MRLISLCWLLFVFTHAHAQNSQTEYETKITNAEDDSTRIMILLGGAWDLKYSNPAEAISFTNRAIELAKANKLPSMKANSYYYKSMIYYLTNKYDSTLIWSEEALRGYSELGENYGVASVYNIRGLVQEKLGDYDKAIDNYHRSLEYAEKTKNLYAQSNPLHNIGLIYNKLNDYKNALEYFSRALVVREKIGDSTMIAQSYQCLALAYVPLKDTVKAIDYNLRAINYFKAVGDLYDLAATYSNLANIYTSTRRYTEAEKLLLNGLRLHREVENTEGEVQVLTNLAELSNKIKKFDAGATYARRSIKIADSLSLKPELKLAYQNLIISLEELKQFENGFFAQKELSALNDSLLNEEKVRQITSLEAKYQAKEKEQQIFLQQAKIDQNYAVIVSLGVVIALLCVIFILARSRYKKKQELSEREKEISVREAYIQATINSQEDERKRFAQDLHDGMGQLISALRLSLLPVDRETSLEERIEVVNKAESLLNEMHREIRSIAFNLMPHTLVQSGLLSALKEMADRINHSGKIVIRVSSFDVPKRLDEVYEISIYRILQEWINNILKYANATVIEVQLVGHEGELDITVEDNGRGFEPDILQKGEGNGWKNIRSRLNLLKGVLDIDSRENRVGTTITLRVPIVKPKVLIEKEFVAS
jgi:two-component system, NarL family, sensor kinase